VNMNHQKYFWRSYYFGAQRESGQKSRLVELHAGTTHDFVTHTKGILKLF